MWFYKYFQCHPPMVQTFFIPSCLIFQEEISIYMALVFVLEYDVANKMILQYPSVQTFT